MSDRVDSPEPAVFRRGNDDAALTSEGETAKQPLDIRDRMAAVPKTQTDNLVDTQPDPLLKDNEDGGYGVVAPAALPADHRHEGGDPMLDGNAQYGASPLRSARYKEDHEVLIGERHHRGVQPGRRAKSPTSAT